MKSLRQLSQLDFLITVILCGNMFIFKHVHVSHDSTTTHVLTPYFPLRVVDTGNKKTDSLLIAAKLAEPLGTGPRNLGISTGDCDSQQK